MTTLITGSQGYVAPALIRHLRDIGDAGRLVGVDCGFFAHCVTNNDRLQENKLDAQYFCDVRRLPEEVLNGVTKIVYLAAMCNDHISNRFGKVTWEINHAAAVDLAARAKAAGVGRFVYASTCSVYGASDNDAHRTEQDPLAPLTDYSKSKLAAEHELEALADDGFQVTALRFATAAGMSDRMRYDIVLNDLVACALSTGRIDILSDGQPWRPLIHVADMARAMEWALGRDDGPAFVTVNVGDDEANYRVVDLAQAVKRALPEAEVVIHGKPTTDRRDYRVSFARFRQLAPNHRPQVLLDDMVADLVEGLRRIGFNDPAYRQGKQIRLNVLNKLLNDGLVDDRLFWIPAPGVRAAVPAYAE